MKIAAITDDGTTISLHFGRAPYYLVLTVEDGQITSRELRSKLGTTSSPSQPHEEEQHGPGHGMDPASHDKHLQMSDAIADCEAAAMPRHGDGCLPEHASARNSPGW